MRYRLLMGRQALTELAQHGAFAGVTDFINQRQQKLDDLTYRLEKSQGKLLEQNRRRWELAAAAVRHYDVRRVLASIRKELESHMAIASAKIASGSPHLANRSAFAAGNTGSRLRSGIRFFREVIEGCIPGRARR